MKTTPLLLAVLVASALTAEAQTYSYEILPTPTTGTIATALASYNAQGARGFDMKWTLPSSTTTYNIWERVGAGTATSWRSMIVPVPYPTAQMIADYNAQAAEGYRPAAAFFSPSSSGLTVYVLFVKGGLPPLFQQAVAGADTNSAATAQAELNTQGRSGYRPIVFVNPSRTYGRDAVPVAYEFVIDAVTDINGLRTLLNTRAASGWRFWSPGGTFAPSLNGYIFYRRVGSTTPASYEVVAGSPNDSVTDVSSRLNAEGARGFAFVDFLDVTEGQGRASTFLRESSSGTNPAPVITAQPASTSVAPGATAVFSVTATGSGALSYQWRKNGTAIGGATTASLSLTNVTSADAGTYDVVVTAGGVASASAAATLTITASAASRLSNLSVRGLAGTGDQTLIIGLTVSGGASKQVLIRGIGPTLSLFGVAGSLIDPQLKLYEGAAVVGQNDDWGGDANLAGAFAGVGAFPLAANSKDAALLVSLASKSYSAQLVTSEAGIGLVEVYDRDPSSSARLVNLSARNQVGTGANILIVGFAISGTASKSLLIRGIGPTLTGFGVSGALADPQLTVINASGTVVAQNDNWVNGAELSTAFAAVGGFPLPANSKDAALVINLAPGTYTAQVAGVGSTTGVALVELYELP